MLCSFLFHFGFKQNKQKTFHDILGISGVLSRQWLGGAKGLMVRCPAKRSESSVVTSWEMKASYMGEWRQLLTQKRQGEKADGT